MKTFREGVLITTLVLSLMVLGMFYSFKAGGIDIALQCDTLYGFYHNGKLYICLPKHTVKNPKPTAPKKGMMF